MSSVEHTVTVTDTQTGEQRSYVEERGTLANAADASAFWMTALRLLACAGLLVGGARVVAASSQAFWTSTGPPGAVVQATATAPSNAAIVYAGVQNGGVFKSDSAGLQWRAANIGLLNLNVLSLAVSPNTADTVLAGTDEGIFRSLNGASGWSPAAGPPTAQIDSIAFDPTSPSTVYAVSLSGWVGKSVDGGATWQALSSAASAKSPFAVAVDPTQGATIYAGTLDNGVYKSEDAGGSWVERNSGLGNLHVSALAIDPTSPQTIYAGTVNGGAYRSRDGGGSWEAFTSGIGVRGITSLVVDSEGKAYAGANPGVYVTVEGLIWSPIPSPYDFVNAIALGSGSPGRLYVGYGLLPFQPGGVAFTDDRVTFGTGAGLFGVTIGAMAVDPSNPTRVLTCGPSAGWETPDGGQTWNGGFAPGFGLSIAFDPQASGVVYEGASQGVLKSTDGGENWAAATSGLPSTLVHALLVLPDAPGHVVAGTAAGVYRTTDGGASWLPPATSVPATVYALGPGPSSSTLWAGASDGVYRSTDAGASWIRFGNATSLVYAILASSVASGKIFAGTDAGLLVSADGGSTWTAVSGGSPSARVDALAEDPAHGALYAGSLAGAYESVDGGSTWSLAGEGMTNPQVLSLAVLPNGTLLAGTRSGSVFRRVSSVDRGPVSPAQGRGGTREVGPRP